jgi:hypothetical protein
MSRETVRSATSRPSFRSSPWIRGAPQSGFAVAMRLTRALISALMGGRFPVGRPESRVQYSRKRRRCHRRTVSGLTITRGPRHPAQTLASATHKRRSIVRNLGRGTLRLYTASCWRRARFSRHLPTGWSFGEGQPPTDRLLPACHLRRRPGIRPRLESDRRARRSLARHPRDRRGALREITRELVEGLIALHPDLR